MPTITVTSTVSDVAMQRGVAKRLSRQLRAEGCDLNHVLTVFTPAAAVYSGPFAISEGSPEPVAVVSAAVDQRRDQEFRQRLATAISDALRPWVPADRVFVTITGIDPDDHFTVAGSEASVPPLTPTKEPVG